MHRFRWELESAVMVVMAMARHRARMDTMITRLMLVPHMAIGDLITS